MKKLFAILAVAAFLTACGGGEAKTEATTVDSVAAPVVDSAKVDSAKVDSAKVVADTTKK